MQSRLTASLLKILDELGALAEGAEITLPAQGKGKSEAGKPTGNVVGSAAESAKNLAGELAKLRSLPEKLLSIQTAEDLETLRPALWGRKGSLPAILRAVGLVPPNARKTFGQHANALKGIVEDLFKARTDDLGGEESVGAGGGENTFHDISLPGRRQPLGRKHPLRLVQESMLDFFERAGFVTVSGPEVESDYYNFTALNIPPNHPARADHDSFYFNGETLLRTQTSNMQIRAAKGLTPPIAIISPGRVYRRDTLDATHSYTFHQIEGMFIDKDVSFADLKGILIAFCKHMFGSDIRIRLRPDYFPFTEPSCEISIALPDKSSAKKAKSSVKWLEILGAGLMNPVVIENAGFDATRYSGFAFGMGVERIAMLRYGIEDIRVFHESEKAFLHQFN